MSSLHGDITVPGRPEVHEVRSSIWRRAPLRNTPKPMTGRGFLRGQPGAAAAGPYHSPERAMAASDGPSGQR